MKIRKDTWKGKEKRKGNMEVMRGHKDQLK